MITPDLAFQAAANAAAAVYASPPPWITYRTDANVDVRSLHRQRDIVREVMARTSDDLAVMQDLPSGATRTGHAFPLLPTFDALSYFRLVGTGGSHDTLEAYVTDVRPLRYDQANPSGDHVDAVVTNLRYYYARYAPDSSDAPDGQTHITLKALPTLTRNYTGNLFFTDLYIDNATHLPSRVAFSGADDRTFVVDYAMIQGHWLVRHAFYEETDYGPLHIGRVHATIDATFDQFTFPAAAPDPRLAAGSP